MTATDTDPDVDDLLSVVDIADPANGSATPNADGTITYTPNAGFKGTDTFTYTVSDGRGGTDTATITVDHRERASGGDPRCQQRPGRAAGDGRTSSGNDNDPNSDP